MLYMYTEQKQSLEEQDAVFFCLPSEILYFVIHDGKELVTVQENGNGRRGK